MDKIYEAAKYYRDYLNNKRFYCKAARKGVILELELVFREEHFKHLIGLHKLKDLDESQMSSRAIYDAILSKNITYETIKNSIFLSEMEDRLNHFNELKDILFTNKLMMKGIKKNSFNNISADILFTKDSEQGILELFLKNSPSDISVPVTFILAETNKYKDRVSLWTILEMKEMQQVKENKVYRRKKVQKVN